MGTLAEPCRLDDTPSWLNNVDGRHHDGDLEQ